MLETNVIQDEAPAIGVTVERPRWRSRLQLAQGLAPTPRPWFLLLLTGVALGPYGLGILSDKVLSVLDPAVSAALATLGAFIGMEMDVRRFRPGSLLAAGNVEAVVTLLTVAAGMLAVDALLDSPLVIPWLLAVLLGLCAASSATQPPSPDKDATALGGSHDVIPIVLGLPALAAMRAQTPAEIATLTFGFLLVILAVAVACWLLVSKTSSVTEERVFAIGGLLLLGGAAAYLSSSALFAGFAAGVLWRAAGTDVRDRIAQDLGYLQRPVVGLLLLVAGAKLNVSLALIGFIAFYVLCRIAGKLAGRLLARRLASHRQPDEPSPLSPGIVGLAFALNVVQVRGHDDIASTLFTIVVVGSFAVDLASLLIREPKPAA
jgi:hypothetical protein